MRLRQLIKLKCSRYEISRHSQNGSECAGLLDVTTSRHVHTNDEAWSKRTVCAVSEVRTSGRLLLTRSCIRCTAWLDKTTVRDTAVSWYSVWCLQRCIVLRDCSRKERLWWTTWHCYTTRSATINLQQTKHQNGYYKRLVAIKTDLYFGPKDNTIKKQTRVDLWPAAQTLHESSIYNDCR